MRESEFFISAIKEYLRLRVSMYIETMIPEQKLKDNQEIRLYDNIMEIVSMFEYANIKCDPYTEKLIKKMKERHKLHMERLMKEGKYKII